MTYPLYQSRGNRHEDECDFRNYVHRAPSSAVKTVKSEPKIIYGGMPYTRAQLIAKRADSVNKAATLSNEFAREIHAKAVIEINVLLGA